MFWNTVRTMKTAAGTMALVPLSLLGFSFVRRWSLWLAQFSIGGFAATALSGSLSLITNAITLIVVALLARAKGPILRRNWPVPAATFALVVGSALALFPNIPVTIAAAGVVATSVGFSLMFLMWLELYGTLEPRRMIVAYCGSMLLSTVLYLLLSGYEPQNAPWVILVFPLISAACLVIGALRAEAVDHTAADLFAKDARKCKAMGRECRTSIGKILIWVATFGLAFGMGDAVTNLGISGSSSIVGRTGFALVMLMGMLFFARRFSLRIAYSLSLPLMIAGLAIAFLFNADPWVSQTLMSAGMEGYQALCLIVSCGIAVKEDIPTAFLCGLVFAVETLAIQAGKSLMMVAAIAMSSNPMVIGICAIIALVVATTCLFRESDLLASYSETALRAIRKTEERAGQLALYARGLSLTDKEESVFLLMAGGRSTRAIADELYLAQSTVRVHTSKIYQKMGIHTREEFDIRIADIASHSAPQATHEDNAIPSK